MVAFWVTFFSIELIHSKKGTVRFLTHPFSYNKDNRKENRRADPMYDVELRYVRGHVEVYSPEGQFLFSADTAGEAMRELRDDEY